MVRPDRSNSICPKSDSSARICIDALGTQVEAHTQDVYAFAGARCDAVVAHVLAELQRQGRIRTGGSG